ncbi:MAG: hypothetical protein WBO14_14675 [Gammaproteobacteria bacterium]|jgi:hypothetical protein
MTEANSTETTNHAINGNKAPSDARIILGPLVKYAAMGLVLVIAILTTAVMLDHRLNDIDREVAALEAELAAAGNDAAAADEAAKNPAPVKKKMTPNTSIVAPVHQAETHTKKVFQSHAESVTDVIANAEEPKNTATSESNTTGQPVEGTRESTRVAATTQQKTIESTFNTRTLATESDVNKTLVKQHEVVNVMKNERGAPFDQSFEAVIAERNAYLKHRDHIYLEDFKSSQDKQLEFMRERLARQEQRIKEMEARFRERYDMRAGNLKEMQALRERNMPDRI